MALSRITEAVASFTDLTIGDDLTLSDDLLMASDANIIKFGADADVTLTHVHNTGLLLNSTMAIQFNDSTQSINAPNATTLDINATDEIELTATLIDVVGNLTVSGTVIGASTISAATSFLPDAQDGAALGTTSLQFSDLFLADGAVIGLGDDNDTTLTHVADTGILLNSSRQLQFGDSATFISQSADGVLDLQSDTNIELTATLVDLNGNLDVSGTALVTGVLTTTAATVFNGGFVSNAISTISTNNQLLFRDTGLYIYSSTDGQLDIAGDAEVSITSPIVDIDASTGIALDGANLNSAWTVNAANKIQFRDTGLYIHSSTDGQLDIVADTEIQIAATTIDINGNVEISGTAAITGIATFTDDIIIGDGKTIGSASDVDAMTIASNGQVTFTQTLIGTALDISGDIDVDGTLIGTALDISGDIDVDGTTNLDVVDVDGAVNFAADVTFADGADIITASAGTSNTRVGVNAGNSIESGAYYNVLVGDEAGTAITTGDYNIALGHQALETMTGGQSNIAIGYQALKTANVASGQQYNVAIGDLAGTAVTTGVENTIIGGLAGDALTDADYNVAIGVSALSADTKGNRNIAIGYHALVTQNFTSSTDSYNVAVGYAAGGAVSTGIYNTLIGSLAGDALTDADTNVAIGASSLTTDTKGSKSTAVGHSALEAQNFTSSTITYNTAIGSDSGKAISTGTGNTILGSSAGSVLTTGLRNTLLGYNAGLALATSNSDNVFVGQGAGAAITSGDANTIIGRYSGNAGGLDIRAASNHIVLSDGDGNPRLRINTAGYALFSNIHNASTRKTAANHVIHQTTADISLIVENSHASGPYGMYMDFSGAAPDNTSNYFITCADTTSNRFIIKSDGDVQNHDNSYGAISDVKLKEQITDASSQWDDIKALTIRKYKMKTDVATGDSDAHWRLGVVAQEVETAGMNGLVKDNPDLDKNNTDLGTTTKTVKYSILYMKAVKALQEAMTRIEALEADVKTLKGE